jgi:hypothetical protein
MADGGQQKPERDVRVICPLLQGWDAKGGAETLRFLIVRVEERDGLLDVPRRLARARDGLALKAMVELANIVQRREGGQPRDLDLRQVLEPAQARQRAAEDWQVQQLLGAGRHVRAVVLQRMPGEDSARLILVELAPEGGRRALHEGSLRALKHPTRHIGPPVPDLGGCLLIQRAAVN